MPNIPLRNTCLVLSFKKLTWRNWDPVTRCITQQRRLNNCLCQTLTMTELEQGFSVPCPPQGTWHAQLRKESLLSLSFEITLICICWENGATWKTTMPPRGARRDAKHLWNGTMEHFNWMCSVVWWSPRQCFKESGMQQIERPIQMVSRDLPYSSAVWIPLCSSHFQLFGH